MERKLYPVGELDFVIHPGETLQEILEERGLTAIGLANATGLPRPRLEGILRCDPEYTIDREAAHQLERTLGVPERLWLRLQENYDSARAKQGLLDREARLDPDGVHDPENTQRLARLFGETLRILNYATREGADGLEYPGDVYALLGSLYEGAARLERLLTQLGRFLDRQLKAGALAVTYGPLEGQPGRAVQLALAELERAIAAGRQLEEALREAQNALGVVSGVPEEKR